MNRHFDDLSDDLPFETGKPLQKVRALDDLRGELRDVGDITRFIEAGNAVVTLVSKTTGARYTFKFARPGANEDEQRRGLNAPLMRCIWVSVLSGDNNETDYSFIGTIFPQRSTTDVRPSTKSKVGLIAPSATALQWFLRQVYGGAAGAERLTKQLEVWHEGRCGRCGRRLTVPQSVRQGFGPECVHLVGGGS